MTVFDYIKYSSTDLDSEEELDVLPGRLLQLYNDEVHAMAKQVWQDSPYERYTTRFMARWRHIGDESKQSVFLRALKKYSNDLI